MAECPKCHKDGVKAGKDGVLTCNLCGWTMRVPVEMTTGLDPVTALLFKTLRPDLILSLQDRVTKETGQITNNLTGLLQIATSLMDINDSLQKLSKLDDTFKEVRNTIADTNQRLKELSDKL